MDKELAYETNGSVYFRVSKHGKYGNLASLDKSGMEVRATPACGFTAQALNGGSGFRSLFHKQRDRLVVLGKLAVDWNSSSKGSNNPLRHFQL